MRQCSTCSQLQDDLAHLRAVSEERARQDHSQCVAMYQQMQQLAQLNSSLANACHRRRTSIDESLSDSGGDTERARKKAVAEDGETQLQRLHAIIIQQAKELETLRRQQRGATADGCMRRPVAVQLTDNQVEEDESTQALLSASPSDLDASDDDEEDEDVSIQREGGRQARRHASHLRKLPLTSLHAQLKGKELQVRRLQQLVAKLTTRFEQLVDRKRVMTQSYQQTAKTQQVQLKKYLAHIQQQTMEKQALERQVRDLNQYVVVLEERVVSGTRWAKSTA
ncbi:hypothetical protein BBJ28_00014349 [Nothophytophthora sp. Chile5]|nr:hypothetical protein BBJ28_00014349 [Nothophytophthora sp. Chile5]